MPDEDSWDWPEVVFLNIILFNSKHKPKNYCSHGVIIHVMNEI